MNIGSVVDFPGRKPYCVLPIDVICCLSMLFVAVYVHLTGIIS